MWGVIARRKPAEVPRYRSVRRELGGSQTAVFEQDGQGNYRLMDTNSQPCSRWHRHYLECVGEFRDSGNVRRFDGGGETA